MPSISYDSFAAWSNYHLTLGLEGAANPVPSLMVESIGKVHAGDVGARPGLERFAATAETLFHHVALVKAMSTQPAGPSGPVRAGIVGRGWSFRPLIGNPISQLLCDGLAGTAPLHPDEQNPACPVRCERIALTSGGTRLRELVEWGEQSGLTVHTSGTHLGPTIAGAAATASHGSRLGYGGVQNMVLGMHLVVGEKEHVWLERASCPVLSELGQHKLAIAGAEFRFIQSDETFEDALVHLGGMGIVNGLAIELVPNHLFALMRRRARITPDWLRDLASGTFDSVATRLNARGQPAFYELTVDPHAPFDGEAAHIMYFPRSAPLLLPPGPANNPRPADAIGQIGDLLLTPGDPVATSSVSFAAEPEVKLPDPVIERTLRRLLDGQPSVFAYYRAIGDFEASTDPFDPNDPALKGHYWSGLHGDEITGNTPGALYNASFAIPLEQVEAAIPAICTAVEALEPSFVFTLRFVAHAAGTLAFTRFCQSAVIEIDGLSPLICKLAAVRLNQQDPDYPETMQALAQLSKTLPKGARAVRDGLEAARIPYSMHWAKLGDLDRAKVYADFGHPGSSESLIGRWRNTRSKLLSPLGQQLFSNIWIETLGLL